MKISPTTTHSLAYPTLAGISAGLIAVTVASCSPGAPSEPPATTESHALQLPGTYTYVPPRYRNHEDIIREYARKRKERQAQAAKNAQH
ncbi:MAG: hypothetical protein IJA63_00810 [Akkermansia sp.]|nr:hypothetical protein [Akkermansia sp.]